MHSVYLIRKQDQYVHRSYYSIPKIHSTILSISLPINMTSKIEERRQTSAEKQESRVMSKKMREKENP